MAKPGQDRQRDTGEIHEVITGEKTEGKHTEPTKIKQETTAVTTWERTRNFT